MHSLRLEADTDFTIFQALDSDSDHLPVGPVRHSWSREALESKDREIEVIEARYRSQIFESANRIRTKLSPNQLSHPTSASGTSRAEHDSRLRGRG